MDDCTSLPYRTFDKLRSVQRSEIVENKRLDEALAMVAEMQAGRDLQRSQRGPRRTGQVDHMFEIPDGRQWTSKARAQAWAQDGFHERSCRHRTTGTGSGEHGDG